MMNKVLITGLGVAKELGICEICNLNFSWLVNNPSTILWLINYTYLGYHMMRKLQTKNLKVISYRYVFRDGRGTWYNQETKFN